MLKDTCVTAGIRTHILLLTPELESGKLDRLATTLHFTYMYLGQLQDSYNISALNDMKQLLTIIEKIATQLENEASSKAIFGLLYYMEEIRGIINMSAERRNNIHVMR